jgi:hypothetical protein
MSYTPPYPGGWKDFPDTSTPIDAASLDIMDAGIAAAQADADTIATTGYRFVETVYFTSSGNFVKANYPYLRAIRVRMVGGGGGSGGTPAGNATNGALSRGGAGAGYAESFLTNIAGLSSSVTVTVGAGGAAGAAGANAGSTGGASSFGTLVVANGGTGGAAGGQRANGEFEAGQTMSGSIGTGDLLIRGSSSGISAMMNGAIPRGSINSQGGASALSSDPGTTIHAGTGAGIAGILYGGGASGAHSLFNQAALAGAAGAAGIVIVELYA